MRAKLFSTMTFNVHIVLEKRTYNFMICRIIIHCVKGKGQLKTYRFQVLLWTKVREPTKLWVGYKKYDQQKKECK